MDHAHAWDFVAERLRDKFHLIALDFRGFGQSDWEPAGVYKFEDYQLDVAALWREFKLESAPVVGHSMGGNVAQMWAGLFPKRVSKLVLVEGFGPPAREPSEFPERTQRWVTGLLERPTAHPRLLGSLEEVAGRLLETNPHLPEERAAYLAPHAAKEVEGGYAWRFDPAHRLPSPHPYLEEEFVVFWKRIAAPTLALHGEAGPISLDTMQPRYRNFPDLQTAVIPGAAHGIHVEQPEALAEAIEQFVA
jgi:pimeloyl-ACP methyl ester carboxylesterase